MIEAYKIGVTLALNNHVSHGLSMMASDFARTEAEAKALQKRISSIQSQAMKGALFAGIGIAGLSLFKAPLEEAKKFQTETAKFASLGFGTAVTNQAVQFAHGMKTIGTSATENMSLVSDAMAVFKDLHHAEFAAPIMAKMKFANEAVFGQKGGEHSAKFMDMLKVIEFRKGLSSQEEFETQANFVQKVISGSRNRVDATQLLTALKTGGVALSQRSNKDFYLGAEPLIQEFGGNRYGTGAMSIYQNLVQARGTMSAQNELMRLGLLDPKMVKQNPTTGKMQKVMPGAFLGSSILEKEGELALLEKVLLPAFKAKGITDEESVIRELGMILSNRTGSSLMSRIYQQRDTIKMQSLANEDAQDISQLNTAADKTLEGKNIELAKEWHNTLLSLGNAVLPLAISGTTGLIEVLKTATGWMERNQGAVRALSIAFAALSGGLVIRGSILLLTAAFRGLGLALAMNAVGGAAGIGRIALAIGGTGSTALVGALGFLLSPIGLVVAALGTLALAAYAFRPMGQAEIDAQKNEGGVHLSADAAARSRAMGWQQPGTPGAGKQGTTGPTPKKKDDASPMYGQVTLNLDSKKLMEGLFPLTSRGTTGVNPAASVLRPGMSLGNQ